jgi:pSer/pThr/pTyr-binding forkhead associated (FHA) protein
MTEPLRIRVQGPGPGPGKGTGAGPSYILELPGPAAVVGRSRAAHVRLPDSDVSGAHARLLRTAGGLQVEDLGSANGTRAGHQSLIPGRTYELAPGAPVTVGDYTLTVLDAADPVAPVGPPHAMSLPPLRGEAGTATLAAHLVRDMLAGRDGARLRVQDPAGQEQLVPLALGDRVRLGRDPACRIRLEDPDLSRAHAEVHLAPGGATLQDLGSKHGVTVNGVAWTRAGPGPLRHGDEVRLGGSTAWFEDPAEALLAELNGGAVPDLSDAPDRSAASVASDASAEAPEHLEPADPTDGTAAARAPVSAAAPRAARPTGRLGRALLVLVGLALMGAAATLLLWLLT